MARVIRFAVTAPQPANLSLSAVPAVFEDRVWDVDLDEVDGPGRAGRMRYVGVPYGVIELGSIEK